MDVKNYFKVSSINLAFLVLGAMIGPVVVNSGRSLLGTVHAQSKGAEQSAAKVDRPPAPADDPDVEYVTPGVSLGGPVLTNTILAHQIACDRLQVNGFDLLKLQDAMLAALVSKRVIDSAEMQAIAKAGKAERPLRLRSR